MNIITIIFALLINLYALTLSANEPDALRSISGTNGDIIEPNLAAKKSCARYFEKRNNFELRQKRKVRRARRCTIEISPYIVSRCILNPNESCISYLLENFSLERRRDKVGFKTPFIKVKPQEFSGLTEIKRMPIRLKPKDTNYFSLLIPLYSPAPTDRNDDLPWSYLPEEETQSCKDTRRAIGNEYRNISSCNTHSDCGQFVRGTSCGCSNDLIANKTADLSAFYSLLNAGIDSSCMFTDFTVSTCECEEVRGFLCRNSRCEIGDVVVE